MTYTKNIKQFKFKNENRFVITKQKSYFMSYNKNTTPKGFLWLKIQQDFSDVVFSRVVSLIYGKKYFLQLF